jgi:ArsR family transcriptional regulator, virulence genes transcriptional regulator
MGKYDAELYRAKANLCKTLADPTRQMILAELRGVEKTVGEIADGIEVTQPTTSHHLAILRERGIVVARRDGANVYYSLANPRISEACDIVHGVLLSQVSRNRDLADKLLA